MLWQALFLFSGVGCGHTHRTSVGGSAGGIHHQVGYIHNLIHDDCENKCTYHIKYGMLLHKHGGQNDAGGKNPREGFHKLGMLETLAFLHGNVNPDRVIYMNTRKQVRRCVGTVNHLAQVDKDIVPGEIVGT